MASTDGEESGVFTWMASVRASMTNDPCRQLFEDQVQTHAFIFLDDYLEHILARPKQGPIIDLVKTPGRRKNVPRRMRATTATAALLKEKTASVFSLDDDKSADNGVPVNSFHKALLQAKEKSAQNPPHTFRTHSPSLLNDSMEKDNSTHVVDVPEIGIAIEPKSQPSSMPLRHCSGDLPGQSAAPFLSVERGSELSVIAEGDESPERAHSNIFSATATSNGHELPQTVFPSRHEAVDCSAADDKSKMIGIESMPQGKTSSDPRALVMSSIKIHHSVPPDSCQEVQVPETTAGNHTEPLPARTVIHSPGNNKRDVFTAPLPVVTVPNSIPIPHTITVPLNDSSPTILAHKSAPAGFPTLPAPSPLRKSIRVTQELTGSAFPSTAPALIPLGKRTSWLMKAREAKAMEGATHGNSVAAVTTTIPRVSIAVKRKSEEMLDPLTLPPGPDWEMDQPKPKVAKSTEGGIVPLISKDTEKTSQHELLSMQGERVVPASVIAAIPEGQLTSGAMDVDGQVMPTGLAEEGFIDLFKRTVEGLGARAGRSMGKPLGGAAVAALAEARAAAEAKVAERDKVNRGSSDSDELYNVRLSDQDSPDTQTQTYDQSPVVFIPEGEGTERRLSLSDLGPSGGQVNEPKHPIPTVRSTEIDFRFNNANVSISAAAADSPPSKGTAGFVKPAGPVFNKPPPVFMPPISKQPSIAPGDQCTLPVTVSLGIPARLSPSHGSVPHVRGTGQMSVQPPQSDVFSGPIVQKREGIPTWDRSTQDTHYTTAVDDDDDSWPLEEKLAAAEQGWRPFDFSNVDKEDTWSSLPSESQGPTRNLTGEKNGDPVLLPSCTGIEVEIDNEDMGQEPDAIEVSDTERSIAEASELEEATKAVTIGLGRLQPVAKGASQTSAGSTASSSQSQAGFFSQATKLVNSMLGGGKKAKPELKSLQLAAAAAKRQQEEADKKNQRLKDMETRRQVANAKKAEEERTRVLEEEKKTKEELEKRKREREENTDRRPPKIPVSAKKEDDASKKRRIGTDTEKKTESKKPTLKDKKDTVSVAKSVVTPGARPKGAKVATTVLVSSAAYNATQNAPPAPSAKPAIPEAKPFRVVPSSLKGKGKAKPQEDDLGDQLPSTLVQSQMAARAKAQMQAAKLPTPEVMSEAIELPEINSEYSDSEDEDRVRTFDPPEWAQSPELRQALQMQSTVNPDDIFGAIRPLRMEEMFRTRQSRFRARTSSANWSGSDRLTVEEIREYERRMGFQQGRCT